MPGTDTQNLEIEKKSIASSEIIEAIKNAKTAVVTAHVNPDGDTLGSMLALAKVLEDFGLERVDRVMHDEVPAVYKFFPDQEKVLCSMKDEDKAKLLDEYDLSFSCDCGSIKRLGSAGNIWDKAKITMNVDHHLSNPLYADLNWVDAEATCTGQVVKDILYSLNSLIASDAELKASKSMLNIDKDLASLLYITLLTDTGGFRHSNTTPHVFGWASELVDLGAEPSKLYNLLFNQMPYRTIRVIGDALDNVELVTLELNSRSLSIVYTTTSRTTLEALDAKDEDTDEIVDHLMRIKDVDMCLDLREDKQDNANYKGSLRSACDIDCSAIALELNGGGHARAAGFNCASAGFEDLKSTVLNKISEKYS